jgi:hypothetical protein
MENKSDIVCQGLQEVRSCGQKEVSKQIKSYEQQSKLVLKLGASSVRCTTVVNQMLEDLSRNRRL